MLKLSHTKHWVKRRFRRATNSVLHLTPVLQECRTPEADPDKAPVSNEDEYLDVISDCLTISLTDSIHQLLIFEPEQKNKFTFMESVSVDVLLSPSKVGRGGTLRLQHELQTEIAEKEQKLSSIQKDIWQLESRQGLQDVENCMLDNQVAELKKVMERVKADIAMLHEHEAASINTLRDVFELKKKEIDVEFDEKLTKIKEKLTDEIVLSVAEMRQKDMARKEVLQSGVAKLHNQIKSRSTDTKQSLSTLQKSQEKSLAVLREGGDAAVSEIHRITEELEILIAQKRKKRTSLMELILNDKKRSASKLDSTMLALRRKQALKEEQKKNLEAQLTSLQEKIELHVQSKEKIVQNTESYNQATKEYLESYNALELERRVLHNKLQELKGNFRVFCRVRPSLDASKELLPIQIMSREQLSAEGKQVLKLRSKSALYDYGMEPTKSLATRNGSGNTFEFDRIFAPESDNSEVFLEISQLVQSSLDGFNVCVFAYGQTGSGKTWTMSHAKDGMIPLSIGKIFSDIQELKEQGWEYTIDGQFVEIYNEQILDLLAKGKQNAKLEVKHDDLAKRTIIANCTTVRLQSRDHAIGILETATMKRSTASTLMNSRSSRSHSVFLLSIRGRNEKTGATCEGALNLIDLAGSERLNSSQVKGERLKETQAINKSLSCLGDVIHNLGQQQNQGSDLNPHHVPYRNSKLTYLLKHSLGGDSKTLMFVNVSLHAENENETINSLRFAKKVNSTKIR